MVEKDNSFNIEEQIAALQQQQSETIQLLKGIQKQIEKLSIKSTETESKPQNDHQSLQIGNRVRILNPRIGQPSVGTIVKLSKYFVFVEIKPGYQIRRASKNIKRIQEDE